MTSPHTPSPAPRQLLRSRTHRLIAGVAGGIGQYLGVDAVIVRLAFVVLALIGGLGALLYLAAWLIVPEDASDPEDANATAPGNPGHTWIAIGAVALLVLLGGVGSVGFGTGFHGGVLWPLVIVGLGAGVLWVRNEHARVATVPSPLPTGTAPDASVTGGPEWWSPAASAPRPYRRSILRRAAPVLGRAILVGLIGFAAFVVSLLAVVVLEGATAVDVTWFEAAVVGSVSLGLAVWVGIVIHRAPELIACALAIAVVAAAAAWLEPPLHGGYGTRDIHPGNVAAVHPTYQLAGGRLRLDLSDVTLARRTDISMDLGVGLLQVVVPRGTTVVLDGRVGVGELCAFGRRDSGSGIERSTTVAGGPKTVHLTPRVGAGAIIVAGTRAGLQTACA
jgi:phage shock protein PspC (stress-responsive transcriptional regulator)